MWMYTVKLKKKKEVIIVWRKCFVIKVTLWNKYLVLSSGRDTLLLKYTRIVNIVHYSVFKSNKTSAATKWWTKEKREGGGAIIKQCQDLNQLLWLLTSTSEGQIVTDALSPFARAAPHRSCNFRPITEHHCHDVTPTAGAAGQLAFCLRFLCYYYIFLQPKGIDNNNETGGNLIKDGFSS